MACVSVRKRARCASYRRKGRESDLSTVLLQPSFQIRTDPSPENVTFSRSKPGEMEVQKRMVGGRQMGKGVRGGSKAAGCRFSQGGKEQGRRDAGLHLVLRLDGENDEKGGSERVCGGY